MVSYPLRFVQMVWCSLATTQCETMDAAQQLYLVLGRATDAFGDNIPQNATKQFASKKTKKQMFMICSCLIFHM